MIQIQNIFISIFEFVSMYIFNLCKILLIFKWKKTYCYLYILYCEQNEEDTDLTMQFIFYSCFAFLLS